MLRNSILIVQQQFLRAKETVMKVTTNIQENAEDILAEAKIINEERAASEAVVEDETTENVTEDVTENVTEKENEETAQTEAE